MKMIDNNHSICHFILYLNHILVSEFPRFGYQALFAEEYLNTQSPTSPQYSVYKLVD